MLLEYMEPERKKILDIKKEENGYRINLGNYKVTFEWVDKKKIIGHWVMYLANGEEGFNYFAIDKTKYESLLKPPCIECFDKGICDELVGEKNTIKERVKTLISDQNISKKWQGKYHYLDEEGRTAGGDWTGHYTNYRITKDSVHLTTSGHMSGREDYYLAEEKGDTLMLYRYQDIRNNNSLYKQIEQEKLYKKGDTYYFLVNEQEKKGVKVE